VAAFLFVSCFITACSRLVDPEPGSAAAQTVATSSVAESSTTTTVLEASSTSLTVAAGSTRPVTKPPSTIPAASSTQVPPAPPATTKPQASGRAFTLGQPFSLRVGETSILSAEGLTVKFAGMLGDSRCPPNVQCFWAGNARIAIEVAQQGSSSRLELNTFEGDKTVFFNSYLFNLQGLSPSSAAPESQYIATLVVTKG
jgi:hypothetical protein